MKLVVHTFKLGDVDDPEMYVAQPLWEWQESPAGQWVMEHSIEQPVWQRYIDTNHYMQVYKVVADLSEQDATYFQLKWGIK
jgi:hypothetical protein